MRRLIARGARRFLALLILAGAGLSANSAEAALKLCNRSSYIVYAAIGVERKVAVVTHGWTRIDPGDCATAISEPLTAPAYFSYARTSSAYSGLPEAWAGQFRLCVKNDDFTLIAPLTATSCQVEGSFATSFAPILTNGARDWTLTFTESPALDTPERARDQGLMRLLAEAGFPAKPGPKGFEAALAAFRTRAALPGSAPSAALFAQLEMAAKLRAAPAAGYSICNDGKTPLWAALGFKSGSDFESQGWWQVASGRCATAITEALSRQAVYLFATREGNDHLVTGQDTFCIANASFDIRGRSNCAARGFALAGFLATNVKGLPGFAAHIGDRGLAQATSK